MKTCEKEKTKSEPENKSLNGVYSICIHDCVELSGFPFQMALLTTKWFSFHFSRFCNERGEIVRNFFPVFRLWIVICDACKRSSAQLYTAKSFTYRQAIGRRETKIDAWPDFIMDYFTTCYNFRSSFLCFFTNIFCSKKLKSVHM